MEILPKPPSTEGLAEKFTGTVFIDVIYRGEEPSRLRAQTVRFAPGARTAWHSHAVGQTLYVTDGVGLVQAHGDQVQVVRSGEVIHTLPGEWHWHGATPDDFITHIALWEAPAPGDDTPESQWGDHVTDQEYLRPR